MTWIMTFVLGMWLAIACSPFASNRGNFLVSVHVTHELNELNELNEVNESIVDGTTEMERRVAFEY